MDYKLGNNYEQNYYNNEGCCIIFTIIRLLLFDSCFVTIVLIFLFKFLNQFINYKNGHECMNGDAHDTF